MADDQPDISPDLDVPLPQVPADSALVPYRTARRIPGQQPVVTTGYGARAQPLMSPSPGTQGVPDLSRMMRRAFEQLPVDQAIKATNAAQQFMGQRMFSQAVQKGVPLPQAWATYGKMMFAGQSPSGAGFAEAMQQAAPPPTPKQYPGMGVAFGDKFYPQRAEPKPAASVELVDEIQKANREMQLAESRGDKAAAEQARQRSELLQSQAKGGISMELGPGGTLSSFSMGGGAQQKPTIAMATQAQEKLVRYKNSLQLMDEVEKVLKPEHLGVRGVAGELLVDKGLQQAAEAFGMPDVASSPRIQSRKLVVALREGLMREMNDTSRFSMADREEIAKALPSSGVWESGKDAQEGLKTVRNVLTLRSRNYAKGIGRPTPLWSLSREEIRSKYPNATDLVTDSKKGLVDKGDAVDALVKYY